MTAKVAIVRRVARALSTLPVQPEPMRNHHLHDERALALLDIPLQGTRQYEFLHLHHVLRRLRCDNGHRIPAIGET